MVRTQINTTVSIKLLERKKKYQLLIFIKNEMKWKMLAVNYGKESEFLKRGVLKVVREEKKVVNKNLVVLWFEYLFYLTHNNAKNCILSSFPLA